jgi:hypothetical protein
LASPATPQGGQDLVAGAAPKEQQGKWVRVKYIGHEVNDRGRMLTGIGPVRARASRSHLAGTGQEFDARRRRVGYHLRGQLAVQQGGGVGGTPGDGVEEAVPFLVGEHTDPYLHGIRFRTRTLDRSAN